MEGILMSVVRKTYQMYPDLEWDDLVGQAWLIVAETVDSYDSTKGTSLSTYIYNSISYGLSDYARRVVLKELNLNGLREHADYLEATTEGYEDRMIAKLTLESMVQRETGVSRDILQCLINGMSQSDIGRHLGLSKQYVSQVIGKIREKYKA